MTASVSARPSSWLRELARLKPARPPWRLSIRAALAVGLPLTAGFLADAVMTGMWISMGALLLAAGERAGSYRSIIRQIVIAAPIGAAGYFAGLFTELPWITLVSLMGLAGFCAGILSSYGAAFSVGAMQALLTASIAIGVPAIAPFWQPAALYLAGAVLYCVLVGIEALVFPRKVDRDALAATVSALAALASRRAGRLAGGGEAGDLGDEDVEAARQRATDRLAALYTTMLDERYHHTGRDPGSDALAALVQRCDATFAALMSATDVTAVRVAADRLGRAAEAIAQGRTPAAEPPPVTSADPLVRAVGDLLAGLASPETVATPAAPRTTTRSGRRHALAISFDRLVPGEEDGRSALAVALCIALAYASHWVVDANHWFWIPLTVGLVMKPDFGSIFARALLRSVGTLGGIVIGALVLAFVPKDLGLVLFLAVFMALTPWLMLRSYALQALMLTPLVLILIDLIAPGTHNVDYALQRLSDTVIGGAIVLVFGYFLWPRSKAPALEGTLHAAMGSVAAYLRAVTASADPAIETRPAAVSEAERDAYRRLSDMRAVLQKSLAEPPPAGREAAAWFPLVAAAERICDRITAYSASVSGPLPAGEALALARLADEIAAAPTPAAGAASAERSPGGTEPAIARAIRADLAHIGRLVEPAA